MTLEKFAQIFNLKISKGLFPYELFSLGLKSEIEILKPSLDLN